MRLRWRVSKIQAPLLLVGVAENADEDNRRVQITGDVDIIDGDQARFADRELPADDFANLALQEFAHALESAEKA